MWDADSLLPVGETFVDLSCMMRQQERVVSVAREYELTSTVVGAPDMTTHADAEHVDSTQPATIVLGKLLVRRAAASCQSRRDLRTVGVVMPVCRGLTVSPAVLCCGLADGDVQHGCSRRRCRVPQVWLVSRGGQCRRSESVVKRSAAARHLAATGCG